MASVLVIVADGSEELETVTIVDLLRRAGINVVLAGLQDGIVQCSRGVRLVPDMALEKVLDDTFDMVVLPGGLPGADHLNQDPRVIALLKRHAEKDHYCAAICAAPKVLANAGLLDGVEATAYPGTLEPVLSDQNLISDQLVVSDGKIVTGRGPGAAIDFALTLIEKLLGKQTRDETEGPLLRREKS